MYGETLPSWFWVIYYLFLVATCGAAIVSLLRRSMVALPVLVLIISISIPIVSLINSIGRAEDMNEFEHLYAELQQGAFLSIYIFLGYLFLIAWWVLFLVKMPAEKQTS